MWLPLYIEKNCLSWCDMFWIEIFIYILMYTMCECALKILKNVYFQIVERVTILLLHSMPM